MSSQQDGKIVKTRRVWFQIPDAAKKLGVCERTLRSACESGKLDGIRSRKIGRKWLLLASDVMPMASGVSATDPNNTAA